MEKKREQGVDFAGIDPEDALKYEIAEELGLREKLEQCGWKALTAKETGRIGGLLAKRRKGERK